MGGLYGAAGAYPGGGWDAGSIDGGRERERERENCHMIHWLIMHIHVFVKGKVVYH